MRGLHLTADLYQCRCEAHWLADAQALGRWSREAAEAAGLRVEGELFQGVAGGATAALLLPQSHVCLHTCAQERSVALDVYLAGAQPDLPAAARALMDALVGRFQPEWTEQRSLDRGDGQ